MINNSFTDVSVPDQTGRCFMVTGANTGLGFEAARVLAARGARVLMACRNPAKAEDAMARIAEACPGADLAFVPLDQGSLASVREAADIAARESRLDVLVSNAGLMSTHHGVTSDGFEHHMGVNHLGTFALTLLLLPKLAATPGARVVITSSLAHRMGKMDFDNLADGGGAKPGQLYGNSKLANLLFALELDRRLRAAGSGISAVACHPGMAATELSRDMPAFVRALSPLLSRLVNSSLQGAWPTLQAATDPEVTPGGYYGPQRLGGVRGPSGPARRTDAARSSAEAQRLWALSEELTGVCWPL